MAELSETLDERGIRYGEFELHAEITQAIKRLLLEGVGLEERAKQRLLSRVHMMKSDQIECIEMTAHKLGRILNGDPHYADSWIDIAGYNKLVADRLEGVTK